MRRKVIRLPGGWLLTDVGSVTPSSGWDIKYPLSATTLPSPNPQSLSGCCLSFRMYHNALAYASIEAQNRNTLRDAFSSSGTMS